MVYSTKMQEEEHFVLFHFGLHLLVCLGIFQKFLQRSNNGNVMCNLSKWSEYYHFNSSFHVPVGPVKVELVRMFDRSL